MAHKIKILPNHVDIMAEVGENLLAVLRRAGLATDAPCGGNGTCGKCKVFVDGREVLACHSVVAGDMTVTLQPKTELQILTEGNLPPDVAGHQNGYCLAFDIGTTTVAGYLLSGVTVQVLACESAENAQTVFGADVVSRIRYAVTGSMEDLICAIRKQLDKMARILCEKARISPEQVEFATFVGNPAMQQLFLGLLPDNLVRIPFEPLLREVSIVDAAEYIPSLTKAKLAILPDISGYVGADVLAGVLSTKMDESEELTLLVDIGTNGEMVLGTKNHMVSCATAAGPALEGATIQFGMTARPGAIDHVWVENGQIRCSVIGDMDAVGICGSGIVDAVAVALDLQLLNGRGKVMTEDRRIYLTEKVYLNQEDIRQVQLAKGAIAAGIEKLTEKLGVDLLDVQKVYLAGGFGNHITAASACRMGLLPVQLEEKIQPVGNAAGSGAIQLALSPERLGQLEALSTRIDNLELSQAPNFQRSFAKNMGFDDEIAHWIKKAMAMGFDVAVPICVDTLQPRADVRDMCAGDRCRAYGKNWTCPPYCGTLESCAEKISGYRWGILLQTVGKTEKTIDTKAYRQTEQRHLQQFYSLADAMRQKYPDALCLGSGGCRICKACAWPELCRFPDKACSSMEGYGLFVTQVCRDNGCRYHYGDKTVTYTGCILF